MADNGKQSLSAAASDVERGAPVHQEKAGASLKLVIIVAMSVFWTSMARVRLQVRTYAALLPNSISTARFPNISSVRHVLLAELFGKPWEMARMSVPSLVYALQNNLDFVALENLDASVYQVTIQLKVVTTAVFMVLMLGRRYSLQRWMAILALGAGVALVQLDAANQSSPAVAVSNATGVGQPAQPPERYYALGLTAVLSTCVTAGFAGVYFEKVLKEKHSTTPFWIRNIQMYLCGMVSAGLSCVLKDAANIARDGFFHGYNGKVVLIIGLLACGGVSISLVMLHLDNMHKSFIAACNIIFVAVASNLLFAAPLGPFFLLGAAIVCAATVMYNTVKT